MPAKDKRALFSLNLDTDADHVYQKVTERNDAGEERVKVIESKGPTHGHTDLSYVTRPFEKTVNRAVNEVVGGSGKKKVHSARGNLTYSTTERTGRSGREEEDNRERERSNLNVVSKIKRRNIERKYDTSEL
jgi:ribose 5-phosphate isomerase B